MAVTPKVALSELALILTLLFSPIGLVWAGEDISSPSPDNQELTSVPNQAVEMDEGVQAEQAENSLPKSVPTSEIKPEQSTIQNTSNVNVEPTSNTENTPVTSANPPAEEAHKFNVFEFVVDGNTVLPATEIEQAVYPFLGEDKTVEDVEKARVALEKAFNKAGYLTVFVNLPEQSVTAGVVRLEVLEGKVDRLKVVGAQYYSLGRIKSQVSELAEGKVPFFPKVQKQIAAVNSSRDKVVAPVLRPGKSPGLVEVDLKVDDKLPLHANIEYNDRYSPNTTKTRLSGNLRYDNLWQRDHSLSIGFQVTPEDTSQTKVFTGTYVMPMDGDYLALYGVVSKSDISAVGNVNVIGNGNIVGARYIHPMPGLEGFNHSVTVGVDYKDFKETTAVLGSDAFNTPISYIPFVLGYSGTYNTPSSTTKLDLNFNFSMRGLGNNEKEFRIKRDASTATEFKPATPNYTYLRGELEHTHRINQWELYGSIGGQATGSILISNEQYTVGGLDSVRGYQEANALADQGVNATLELRTPSLAKYMPSIINQMHALVFYDYGYAKVSNPLAAQTPKFYLASTGIGLNLKTAKGLFLQLDYARALRSITFVESGDERVHFRVGFDW